MTPDHTYADTFGDRLKQAQAERAITNEDAARELDVGLRLYQMWRSGQLPGLPNLIRLAEFYGKPVSWFIDDGQNGAQRERANA